MHNNANGKNHIAVIEIASGDYNVDLNKLMATAVKKYYEERDTYYLNTINRHDYISADSGKHAQPKFFNEIISYLILIDNFFKIFNLQRKITKRVIMWLCTSSRQHLLKIIMTRLMRNGTK